MVKKYRYALENDIRADSYEGPSSIRPILSFLTSEFAFVVTGGPADLQYRSLLLWPIRDEF